MSACTRRTIFAALLVAGATFLPTAHAAIVHQESIDGDLANSGTTPTAISVAPGLNGIVGGAANPDRDYARFAVPDGYRLQSLFVRSGTVAAGAGSFIGLQAGAQVTVDPNGSSAAGLLGWTLFSAADVDTDILGRMGVPAEGSSGFAAPLDAGVYTLWIQELGGRSAYVFDLDIAPVPLPAALWLLLGGLAGLGAIDRRRARRHCA
jgi:hypothetical protein